MAVLASVLITVILIGVAGVALACTRAGRRACRGSTTTTEPLQTASAPRSDLQGPHQPARSFALREGSTVAESRHTEAGDLGRTDLPATLPGDHREVAERINRRLDELDQLVAADEEDLGDMERLIEKSSRRDRRRSRRRPKNRHEDDDSEQFDAA